jgi:hypothetical protein
VEVWLHVHAPLPHKVGWAPESFWTRWWREKFPDPAGNRTPDRPARRRNNNTILYPKPWLGFSRIKWKLGPTRFLHTQLQVQKMIILHTCNRRPKTRDFYTVKICWWLRVLKTPTVLDRSNTGIAGLNTAGVRMSVVISFNAHLYNCPSNLHISQPIWLSLVWDYCFDRW